MSTAKRASKTHEERLVGIEEQMLHLMEVPDSIRFMEERLEEVSERAAAVDAVSGRLDGLPIQDLLARVDMLESQIQRIGNVPYERGDSSSGSVARMEERVMELDNSQKDIIEMINGMSEDFRATLDVVRNEIVEVNTKVNLTMRALANQAPAGGAMAVGKIKIPEPKPFCGARDAKALENFIFDIEQYFKATNTVAEEAKVTLATMHLSEDAKLWWRSRYIDIQEGRCVIDTWDSLKRELRSQFFPENVEILARRKLRELKHTGSIREYVKQFAGLMLDISDMTEKDKIFSFVEGLKPWARTKLYEQKVQDLVSAYATAERLFDLSSDVQETRRQQSSSPGRDRNNRPNYPEVVSGNRSPGRDRKPSQSNTGNNGQRPNNQRTSHTSISCYICTGPHRARECPDKAAFYAFQASLAADSDDTSGQPEEEVGQEERVQNVRVGAIRLLSSLQKRAGETSGRTKGGLMYVDTWINRNHARSTMVDSGATHNFITVAEARRLNLHWKKDTGKMKAVNSTALPVVGVVKRAVIQLGGWSGFVDFVVVGMDDFDVVLGMEFLLEHQVIIMPAAKCLVISGSNPTVVQTDIRQPKGLRTISAMQLREDRVREDTRCVVEKYGDGKRESLPMPGSPTENNHRMAHSESPGLWRQSKRLSSAGFSRPAGAPYKAQGFLREEEKGRFSVDSRVLKQAPRRGPILGSVSVTQPVETYAEACSHALSGVLLQNRHPIEFENQKKSATEGNDTVFEEETLAIAHSLRDGRQGSHRLTLVKEMNNDVACHFGTRPNLTSNQVRRRRVVLKLDFESERSKSSHGVPHVSARTQACQADGPKRDASKESMKENSVAHDGMSLTKAGKLAQKNGGRSLEATQSGVTTMKKSSTYGSPTMSVGDGQYVLSRPVDRSCMKKEPQTCNLAKKWKRRSDTVRANLEKVSKRLKRWADGKHRPLDLHVEGQDIVTPRPELMRFLKIRRSSPRGSTRGINRS